MRGPRCSRSRTRPRSSASAAWPESDEFAPIPNMQSAVQRCRRLMRALEDLAAQEATTLRAGNFAVVADSQDRAEVLIDDLVAHDDAMDDDLRERLKALREVRARSSEWLAIELAQTRDALAETGVAQR